MLAALAKSKRLRRIALAPLSPDAARSLVNDVAQRPDVDDIVARAQGNPLILIEFARSEGAAAEPTGLLAQILETRLARVSQGARELLEWACAFGRAFQVEALLATQGGGPAAADQQLAELERHELIRATGEADYEFSHDLIQQAAYSRISQPRRRLMHKHIARALSRDMQARPQVCAALAYHAGLGGQHELAARASVGAGEQGLRVFANREAVEVARRGLRQASRIPDNAARARLTMALLRIQVLASSRRPLAQLRPDASAVVQAIDVARKHRLHADVAQGYYLLSVVHQDMGHLDAAREATLLAAQASDRSEALGRARQLANSARCLVELGRDIGHARELIAQARTLAESAGIHEIEVRWCTGLLHHWDGDLGSAVREIDVAIELATDAQDRWRQCRCLAAVALIELERGQPQVATARAMALKLAASQLGEGADAPLAQAIDSLARLLSGDPTADFNAAIEPLRRADDKSRLARLLNLAASEQLERGRFDAACTWAEDALALAESIGEANESALAQATLAQAALAQCDPQRARLALAALRPALEAPGAFNARAAKAALAAMGGTQAVRAAPLDSQTERAPR